jgi:hypothetical protein
MKALEEVPVTFALAPNFRIELWLLAVEAAPADTQVLVVALVVGFRQPMGKMARVVVAMAVTRTRAESREGRMEEVPQLREHLDLAEQAEAR